jgi:hypothetical protein
VRSARVISVSAALALIPGLAGVIGVAAAAEPAAAGARLEVHALPDCTTREELAARVAARSRRIHFDDDASGPTLRAVVAPGPHGGAVGELQIAEPSGKISTRRISAPSCAQATDALALIIALTLDPTSGSAAAPAAAAAPATPPTALPSEPPVTPAGPAPPRSGEAAGRTAAATPPEAQRFPPPAPVIRPSAEEPSAVVVAPPEPPVATRTRFGGGVAGEVMIGLAPGVLPGLSVYLLAALDRDSLWSPAAIVRGTHAWTGGLPESGGTAAFTLDALALDACLLRLSTSGFEARACASALYGRLAATGSETYSPATADRPYAALGGALTLSGGLGRFLEVTGRVECGASLVRDSFAFSPTVFHRTAAVTVAASLGLGVRFP